MAGRGTCGLAALALLALLAGVSASLAAPPRPPARPAGTVSQPVADPSRPPTAPERAAHDRAAPEPAAPEPAPATPLATAGGCVARLAALGIDARPEPAGGRPQPAGVRPDTAAGTDPGASARESACTVTEPVRLWSVKTGSLAVDLPDRPLVACAFAEPFAAWIAGIAAPVLEHGRRTTLAAVRTGPGHECRPRNRQAGAKPSAHSTGAALDIAAFVFRDGPALEVGAGAVDPALEAIRRAACGWFTTVLGPGSDPFHATHLHLDIQQHGSSDRYRICQ